MKRHIIFTWELGSGTGHLHKIAPVIVSLQKVGHKITLLSKDIVTAKKVLGDLNIGILPAPIWQGQTRGMRPATNYNEVLFHVGYLQAGDINALVEAWRKLFNLCQAELIITEHSPTAIIAARTMQLPSFTLGTGFSLPPNISPLPTLEPWAKADPVRMQKSEGRALQTVNSILSNNSASPLTNMAELFHQQPSYLLSLPELDHYGSRKDEHYWGGLTNSMKKMPSPIWPQVKGEKVFVYIHPNYPVFMGLIKQLAQLNFCSLVVAPGLDDVWVRQLSTSQLKIITYQVDITEVTQQCRIIINHGSQGMMHDVFSLGKPMLMLPYYTEQAVLAWRAAKQLLGVMGSSNIVKHNYKLLIEKLLSSQQYFDAATEFAEHCQKNPLSNQDLLEDIQQKIEVTL